MKERPIIMSAESVRAILARTKTATRRVFKLPAKPEGRFKRWAPDALTRSFADPGLGAGGYLKVPMEWLSDAGLPLDEGSQRVRCPHGNIGDELWCKEVWAEGDSFFHGHICDPPSAVVYRADLSCYTDNSRHSDRDTANFNWDGVKWRNPLFMPRCLSRLTLRITGIRVERLHDIDDADAAAEGMSGGPTQTPVEAYREAWDALNAKRGHGWVSNPHVWVLSFARSG